MGRPKKSIAELKQSGTYRPSRHASPADTDHVEDVATEQLERPEKLDEAAAEVWDELVELLGGSIRRRDIHALVELCRWIARSDKIAADLDALAPTDKTFKALLINAGIATDKVSDLTKRFGISPADRMKLKAEVPTGPAVAKVPTRPKTKLDKMGAPKREK